MYADLDYEAVRNMEELLQGHSVYLADMNSEKAHIGLQQLVPNAWMASVPRHPFWLICLQRIIRNAGYTEGYMDAEVHMDKCVLTMLSLAAFLQNSAFCRLHLLSMARGMSACDCFWSVTALRSLQPVFPWILQSVPI